MQNPILLGDRSERARQQVLARRNEDRRSKRVGLPYGVMPEQLKVRKLANSALVVRPRCYTEGTKIIRLAQCKLVVRADVCMCKDGRQKALALDSAKL